MNTRRSFIRNTGLAGITVAFPFNFGSILTSAVEGKRVGIIGLDTSHSTAFTTLLNGPDRNADFLDYKVVAAYPWGSKTIKSSYDRIPGYTDKVKALGVEIVDSLQALISKVDVILLETNDGKPHLEQALEVIKAKKSLFIDKPVASSLKDVKAIYQAAKMQNLPIFSSSALRYSNSVVDLKTNDKVGRILGADCFSPMQTEPTHPDLFWYGIHAVEYLFTVMGVGCKQVNRSYNEQNDVTMGVWADGRVGTIRGIKKGKQDYGGTVFGEKAIVNLGTYTGYDTLLKEICKFWQTGIAPVQANETIEIYAFMEAADISKRNNGAAVDISALI